MPVPKLLANYTDPVYANLNAEFAQKSDDFPIALLPVRLETKFKTTTQFISQGIVGESVTHFVVTSYYTILRNVRIWESKLASETKAKSLAKVAGFKTQLNRITSKIATVNTTKAETKRVMAEAAEDLLADLKTLKVPAQIQTAISELQEIVALQKDMINALKLPGVSAYELGYQYFDRLEIIEKNIADIYVNGKVNSQSIGNKLDEIDDAIQTIYSLIKEPNFKATTGTMGKIVSKISYIKRLQKNSYVRLQDFRYGFTGNRNLTSDEYTLRKDINALKTRIDEEHIPFMQLQDSLKTYPTVQLQLRITKAYNQLLASNRVGYRSYDELMTAKKVLYHDLLGIRERAHRPLSAVEHEIHELKNAYQNLEEQIVKFIARSKKIRTADRYKRAALSRLETHLTEEYLEDLKDLLPGVKTIEEQTFSDAKVRTTSSAFLLTKSRLVAVRDAVKNISTKGEAGLIAINDQLKKVRPEIAVSASNTILLSKLMFSDLQNTTNSLISHIDNFVKNNSIDAKNNVLVENKAIVGEIENYIADQQLDVFNARDKFYDKHRKKITFTVNTKTVKELWVRIYPDDIAVDNHDERISPEEEKVGQDYYFEVYKKPEAEREAAKLGAYRAAAASLGVRRAAYVIKALLPTELKNNDPVPAYKDDLAELVKQFRLKLSLKTIGPRNSVDSREEELRQFIENLPREISRRLNPQNFTCCIETKASLDQFLVQIKTAHKRFFKEVKLSRIRGLSEDKTDVIRILNNAEQEVLAFYKDNLEKLNTPFLPNLHFAEFEYKQKSWDRAGICDVMPDRFVVATKRDGVFQHIVTGNEVEKPLHLSIDPSSNQSEEFNYLPNGDLQVPPKLRWMFDFEAAVLAGMAVKIPLTDEDYVKGFDFVMAFGVQNTEAAIGQETINKLFTNHLYSDGGLEFLPVGTATNNTENIKSPYNGLDNDADGAFELFFGSEKPAHLGITKTTELKISDGQFFKDAFGLPNAIAGFIRHYEKKDIVEGRAMNRALYNATIKYYMHIMVDTLLTENDKDRTIEFLMRNVSAVGTIPTFRIDQQPYGVLPITDYKSFLADGNTSKGTEGSYLKTLAMFLKQTRLAFDGFSKKPQTVNGTKYQNDPQAEFLKILGLEPFSKEFYYRFGTNVSGRWQSDDEIDFPINWDDATGYQVPQNIADNYTTLLNDLGYANPVLRKYAIEKTRAYKNRFMTANFIHGPLVQNPELGTESLANITDFDGNYIEWLRQQNSLADIKDIRVDQIPAVNGENQNTLLFMMLRGAMLYDRSGYVKNALNILKNLEVPKLERLLANHIDLCSYRLDAWMGGLSSHRLNKLRQTNTTGTYMGAYGFVADLKRAADRTLVDTLPVGLSPENGENVYRMKDNQGFIHGPSMNHAVAAAVLRAGYTSLKNRGNNNNALAINLSSARVRKALHLLEGVGNGQESGALLGYIFERALHEKYKDGNGNHLEMDTYIYRLRKKFPTFGDLPKDEDINLDENESIRAANVVDGLAMLDYFEEQLKNQNFWDDDKTFVEMIIDDSVNPAQFNGHPWGFGNEVPNPTNEIERLKLRAIVHELDNMADSFDALGDLMNAEGVYQLVRGNHVRASAVLNALAEGKVPLDPEIINSMRQGIMVTHRASLNVRVPQTTDSPWQNVPLSPRAKAENSLNYWLAEQIGNPDDVAWQAIFGNTETYISLQDMGMQPIDLVLLVTAGGDDGMQEIEMRCIDYLLAHGAEEDDKITLNFNISPPTANFSFGEIVSLLQNLGKLITNARPADARDYRIAEDELNFSTTAAGVDLAKLETRITSALTDYKALLASLSPFTPEKLAYSASEIVLAKTKLKELSLWGFAGFYPSREAAANPMDMAARLISAKAAMSNNIAFVDNSLANLTLELDQGAWLTASTEITAKLFGSGFKFLPEFNCTNALDLRIQLDFDAEESIIRNQPEEFMSDWLSTASLVRNRLAPAETVRLLTDVMHQKEISLQPAQLPFDFAKPAEERDYWLGAEYPKVFVPDGDRLSFVCFGHENVAETMCGLIIDEWMEIIPDEKETTGIAFHYNQPDARAPQTILMAVTPQKTGKWNLDEVALAVEEAFNMAKIRAVEPEHIDFSMFSQLLPATSALAFGYDEMMRRELPDENFEADDQVLGMYIDYTAVNHGVEQDNE